MVFAPMVFNAFYFWIADNLIATATPSSTPAGSEVSDEPTSPPPSSPLSLPTGGAAAPPIVWVKRDREADVAEELTIKAVVQRDREADLSGWRLVAWRSLLICLCATPLVGAGIVFAYGDQNSMRAVLLLTPLLLLLLTLQCRQDADGRWWAQLSLDRLGQLVTACARCRSGSNARVLGIVPGRFRRHFQLL